MYIGYRYSYSLQVHIVFCLIKNGLSKLAEILSSKYFYLGPFNFATLGLVDRPILSYRKADEVVLVSLGSSQPPTRPPTSKNAKYSTYNQ